MATDPYGDSVFSERDLVGRYHMAARGRNSEWLEDPEALPERPFHRTYQFGAPNTFEVHYIFFADEACTTPEISAIWQGRCWLLEPHPELPFTRLANFRLDKVLLSIMNNDLFERTPEAQIGGWSLGLYRDITRTGCKSLGLLFEPMPQDYDIVYLHDGILKTGVRTAMMAVNAGGRPTRLQDGLPAVRE